MYLTKNQLEIVHTAKEYERTLTNKFQVLLLHVNVYVAILQYECLLLFTNQILVSFIDGTLEEKKSTNERDGRLGLPLHGFHEWPTMRDATLFEHTWCKS